MRHFDHLRLIVLVVFIICVVVVLLLLVSFYLSVCIFVISFCFALHRTFLPAKVGCVFHTSKQQGRAGKYRELEGKGNAFHRLAFTLFAIFSSFTIRLV